MTHNHENASALAQLYGSLSRMVWLVQDAAQHSQAGVNLDLIAQRLDEIGDVLADAKGFHNSAKAQNATAAAEQQELDQGGDQPAHTAAQSGSHELAGRGPAAHPHPHKHKGGKS